MMRSAHPNAVVHLELHTADLSSADGSLGTLESKRRHHERIVEQLGETEATGKPEGFAYLVLRYGIELNEWIAECCERTARAVEEEASRERRIT